MTLLSTKRALVSASTVWFLATAAVTAALFSSLTSALASSVSANLFVTSASDDTCVRVVVATERAFSAGVAFFSASAFVASFSAACLLSKPAVFDSVTTVLKADTVSAWASTSAWLDSALARAALAVTNTSLAEFTTVASAYFAVESLDSKVAILASSIALFTFLASSTLTSGFASVVC